MGIKNINFFRNLYIFIVFLSKKENILFLKYNIIYKHLIFKKM